jgi:hypothetical protein
VEEGRGRCEEEKGGRGLKKVEVRGSFGRKGLSEGFIGFGIGHGQGGGEKRKGTIAY